MRKRVLSVLIIAFIVSSCIFPGCKKDSGEPAGNDTVQQEQPEEAVNTESNITDAEADPDDGAGEEDVGEDDPYIDEEDHDGDTLIPLDQAGLDRFTGFVRRADAYGFLLSEYESPEDVSLG